MGLAAGRGSLGCEFLWVVVLIWIRLLIWVGDYLTSRVLVCCYYCRWFACYWFLFVLFGSLDLQLF